MTLVQWRDLLSDRDPQAMSTDIRRKIQNPGGAPKDKRTFWQRIFYGERK